MLILQTAALALLLLYIGCVVLQHAAGRSWSPWRTTSFVAGCGLVLAGLTPPLASWGHHSLEGHMAQHLVLGMVAPLGLVFGSPVSLLLRSLSVPGARKLVRFLQSRPVWLLSHPLTTLLLNIGGMYLLYLTPLYALSLENGLVHVLVHLHFILAGCLFVWSIAGPDPGPHRPSAGFRLFVLFLSLATHGFLGKVMYAYHWPRGTGHGVEEIQAAAQLMYYGGDAAEMVLAMALFASWLSRRRPAPGVSPRSGIQADGAASRWPADGNRL